MGCCTGCDTGTGCEGACPGTGCGPGCATCAPPQPAQLFVPNFFPSTGCADGSCSLPPATGRMSVPQWLGAFANAARHVQAPSSAVPRPSPTQAAQASRLGAGPGFWAHIHVLTGEVGMNLRAAPSPRAPLIGAARNGTRVWVAQIGFPEVDAPPGALMEWWAITVPGQMPAGSLAYVRAVGPTGEQNLMRA